MAPEGEPAQAQREGPPQCAGHRAVRNLCVSSPVDRVTLAAGPGAPSIDGAIAGYLSGNVGDRLVVAQGVEVVLEEAARLLVVDARQGAASPKSAVKVPTPILSSFANFSWYQLTASASLRSITASSTGGLP